MKLVVLALLLPGLAFAAEVSHGPTPTASRPSLGTELRGRVGLLGRLSLQPTMFELGGGYDLPLPTLSPRVSLDLDLSLGLRPNIVHLEPMVGLKYVALEAVQGKLLGYAMGLAGLNFGFYRGSLGLGLPLRLGVGGAYQLSEALSGTLELAFDLGPLVRPFGGFQAAARLGAGIAYRL